MVITIGNTKGGTGKSTTAWHLAVWLSRQKKEVLLIDADDSATTAASLFTAHRANCLENKVGYAMIRLTQSDIKREVPGLKDKYDYVIIDTGATDSKSLRAALVVADWLVIPCQPRVVDLWVTQTMIGKDSVLDDISTARIDDLNVLTFISKADTRSQNNRDAIVALQEAGYTVLEGKMVNRKCFENAFVEGLTIFEMKEQDDAHIKAIKELNDLFSELLTHIHHEQKNAIPANS